ncbi:MAG: NifB/NifX family molybdenum-iron cluster-binding protein [Paludibacteraceae bacterium]|jgi:predicted Fe-Mo cluster-binding NifX family protein|nr:NifB/NifX family molybdenum-iron cluster-binding protein [Paludibacteraceae bacterium]
MKIAISSEGNTLSSLIDSRFGRCDFFAIFDTETQDTIFFPNPAKESSEGAGPAAVQFIASKGVKKIVSGEFGGKIKSLLDNLQIDMLNDSGKSISEIIKQF